MLGSPRHHWPAEARRACERRSTVQRAPGGGLGGAGLLKNSCSNYYYFDKLIVLQRTLKWTWRSEVEVEVGEHSDLNFEALFFVADDEEIHCLIFYFHCCSKEEWFVDFLQFHCLLFHHCFGLNLNLNLRRQWKPRRSSSSQRSHRRRTRRIWGARPGADHSVLGPVRSGATFQSK